MFNAEKRTLFHYPAFFLLINSATAVHLWNMKICNIKQTFSVGFKKILSTQKGQKLWNKK